MYYYQILFLGDQPSIIDEIKEKLLCRIDELGVNRESLKFITMANIDELQANAPIVALFMEQKITSKEEKEVIRHLLYKGKAIIPIVSDVNNGSSIQMPEELESINYFKLNNSEKIESLVSLVLESLYLLRQSRRLFISYRRKESTSIATQLYEKLEKSGFDVFLDTHSIRPGDPFQEELWHRMTDTDVIVLLNTKGFLNSEWTKKEISEASAMSIGIFQIIWPDHDAERYTQLTEQYKLNENNFIDGKFNDNEQHLKDDVINELTEKIESLRARNLAARQELLVSTFIRDAESNGISDYQIMNQMIFIKGKSGKKYIMLPSIGIPNAYLYNRMSEENICDYFPDAEKYLLYDNAKIRKMWLTHLDWLNVYLPIKSLKILEVKEWLMNL